MSRRVLTIQPHPAREPEIAALLGMAEDARKRTLRLLEAADDAALDQRLPDSGDTAGSLLYHIAAIEASWLFDEVLEQPFPPEVETLFNVDVRDEDGRLSTVTGESLALHLERLAAVRSLLVDAYAAMPLEEFRRAHSLPDYDVSPEWVLHHLMQHEAEHRSQLEACLRGFILQW